MELDIALNYKQTVELMNRLVILCKLSHNKNLK